MNERLRDRRLRALAQRQRELAAGQYNSPNGVLYVNTQAAEIDIANLKRKLGIFDKKEEPVE